MRVSRGSGGLGIVDRFGTCHETDVLVCSEWRVFLFCNVQTRTINESISL